MKKWNIGIYLRLSVDDGDKTESNSIANQKTIIQRYMISETDYKIVDYYIDDGFSGTTFDRPDFKRLMSDVTQGKINTIVVKDLSRFGRNYIETGHYFENIFPLYDIRFIAINDNIDSFKNPNSFENITIPIKNLMNEQYAKDISIKVRSVLDIKKQNGMFIGSTPPYGYKIDPENKYNFIIDKTVEPILKKIFNMALKGSSKIEIINYLNKLEISPPAIYKVEENLFNYKITDKMKIWTRKKIDTILRNKTYTGDLIQNKRKKINYKQKKSYDLNEDNWIVFPNHHDKYITKKDYDKIQSNLYSRDMRVNKDNKYDLFSGYIKCADCNNSFSIKRKEKYEYYYCNSFLKKKTCTNHSISKTKLINSILPVLQFHIDILVDFEKVLKNNTETKFIDYSSEIVDKQIRKINEKIKEKKMLLTSIEEDFQNNYISKKDYDDYYKSYSSAIEKEFNKRKKLEKELMNKSNGIDNEWVNKIKKNKKINNLTREIIEEFIEDIYIDEKKNIKIVFKYQNEYLQALDFINDKKYAIIS